MKVNIFKYLFNFILSNLILEYNISANNKIINNINHIEKACNIWYKMNISNINNQKKEFIKKIVLLLHKKNENILLCRKHLINIQSKIKNKIKISNDEILFLINIFKKYKVPFSYNNISVILVKVDIIPPSIALAQTIEESGWGNSRSVTTKNSCFGHMKNNKCIKYNNLFECINAYVNNLNINNAYKAMRNARMICRLRNIKIDKSIASGLTAYSIKKMAYIKKILYIIETNKLYFFDNVFEQ